MLYIETTISVWKDGICLFETDCECRVEYTLPDGRRGPVDWDVTEFHFTDKGPDGKPVYTKITRIEPLFGVLYKDVDREWLEEQLTNMLADDGIIDRYATEDVRDYTDLMNMTPSELARHALDCVKVGVLSTALVEALAHQLETQGNMADRVDGLLLDLENAENRATEWQEECRALQRQLDRTYG